MKTSLAVLLSLALTGCATFHKDTRPCLELTVGRMDADHRIEQVRLDYDSGLNLPERGIVSARIVIFDDQDGDRRFGEEQVLHSKWVPELSRPTSRLGFGLVRVPNDPGAPRVCAMVATTEGSYVITTAVSTESASRATLRRD